jgi:hypothetical protein
LTDLQKVVVLESTSGGWAPQGRDLSGIEAMVKAIKVVVGGG